MNIEKIRREWRRTVDEKRQPHVEGCAQTAIRLAAKYGADPIEAEAAALLHDCTKALTTAQQLKLCEQYGIITYIGYYSNLMPHSTNGVENTRCSLCAHGKIANSGNAAAPVDANTINPLEKDLLCPKVLHAHTGAYYARHHFDVSDAVFYAIHSHTTGRAGMTLLDQIIYVADLIEPTRNFPEVEIYRNFAEHSLDKTVLEYAAFTIERIAKNRLAIHPATLETYNFLLRERNENGQ